MCGKCKLEQCKDSIGGLHEIGDSWITTLGKMVCTDSGLKLVRGMYVASFTCLILVRVSPI